MSADLFKKQNNIFQSPEWAAFESSLGRKTGEAKAVRAIDVPTPLGKNFIWVQKGPEKISSEMFEKLLGEKAAFVRLEPEKISDAQVKDFKLKPVTKNSLLCGQASPKATRVLDLTQSEEELLAQMKPKTRYNIRLAEKKGVVIKTTEDVDTFYQMLTATSGKNTGYFPHEKSYYQALTAELGPKDMVKIYIAESDGQPLAAILVTFYGKTATYLHGGQNDRARNLMAPYLCQWAAIKEAKSRGCTYYDFWGVAESDAPDDPWAGISRFKEGFGGEKIITPGSFDLVLRPVWYNILTMLARIKHRLRHNN